MTKILNFALKIKGSGREGGTCEVLRPCHPPKKILNVHHQIIDHNSKTALSSASKLSDLLFLSIRHIFGRILAKSIH